MDLLNFSSPAARQDVFRWLTVLEKGGTKQGGGATPDKGFCAYP